MDRRRSVRLRGFNYGQAGAYFITITCHQRACILGVPENECVPISPIGAIVTAAWLGLADRFPQIQLDEFVIMPNHIHGIIVITDRDDLNGVGATFMVAPPNDAIPSSSQRAIHSSGAGTSPAPTKSTPSLGDVIGAFKSISTHEIILAVRRGDLPPFDGKIWQRNYYEHIIRNETELDQIRKYIVENPLRWALDQENPATKPK